MNVTRKRTRRNGFFRKLAALSQAKCPSPERMGLGGVGGRLRLKSASPTEARPATRKIFRLAATASAPDFPCRMK
jgi:hypothetical protein